MTPIETGHSLIEQVYQRILAAIAAGTLLPGMRVRQEELAALLGVSRQPVSHALHLLKRQGLLQDSGRKGFEVAPIDPLRIRQLYEVRGALDGLAARLAAGRGDEAAAERTALRRILAAGQAVAMAAAPAHADLVHLDIEFHQALYHLSGNPALAELVGPAWPHLSRSMAAVLAAPDYRALAWAEHRVIVDHVEAGEADAAERAARNHAVAAGVTTECRLAELAHAA